MSASVVLALSFVLGLCGRAQALQLPAGASAATTVLTLSTNKLVEGQDITLTATVTSSAGTPSGYVTFYANGTISLFSVALNSKGVGVVKGSSGGYPAGTYTLTAKFDGSSGYAASTSSGVGVTLQSPVKVTAQGIPNPVVEGQKAELQATVSATDGGGTPTGTVTFSVEGTKLGTATLSNGSAVFSAPTTGIKPGTYPVVATYNGDSLHGTGNSSAVDIVLQAPGGAACGTGNESILNGTYGFILSGYDGTSEVPFKQAGSFVANGSGGITGGEEDFNFFTSTQKSTISNLSLYSVGSDGRGCLTLVTNNEPTHTYRFSLIDIGGETNGVSDGGRLIEFDDKNGSGIRATGGMVQDNTSEFSLASLLPNYSFLAEGYEASGAKYEPAALLGTFAQSSGAMSSGVTDLNVDGAVSSDETFSSGTISSIDNYGRATMSFTVDSITFHYVVYFVNKGYGYLLSSDTGSTPILSGEMHEADDDFTNSNVPKTYIAHVSGRSATASDTEQELAQLTFSDGNYSETIYTYIDGTAATSTDSGTYSVKANGRLVMTSDHNNPQQVLYALYKGIAAGQGAYLLSFGDTRVLAGGADVQVSESYSDSAVAGKYGYGHDVLLTDTIVAQSGEVTLSSSGALSGMIDLSGPSGLSPAQSVDLGTSFDFNSSGISSGGGVVGMATGSNIYYMVESGDSSPIIDLTTNNGSSPGGK
jgi:hypothetical protein